MEPAHAITNSIVDHIYLIILAMFYVIAIFNVLTIVREEVRSSSAVTWIFVNIGFPMIGVPLYFFLGQTKLKSYTKRRRRFEKYFKPPHLLSRSHPIETKNNLSLLCRGQEAFDTMFEAIASANTFILIQYYIFRSDKLGNRFRDLLVKKAKQGVAVYFVYDNLGSIGLTGSYVRFLRKNGVFVARFLPFSLRFNLQINFRNHRKLVLIDGKSAFIGGMNVGVEYLGRKRFWRDTQVKIEGPAVESLAYTFLEDWNFAATFKKGRLLKKLITRNPSPTVDNGHATKVFSFGPGDDIDHGLFLFMTAINNAKESITIATPYFIPDLTLEKCLELAIFRGIKVCLIVPKRADHWYVQLVNHFYLRRFIEFGADVYQYEKGFMHQKVMLLDGKTVIIGTANFDNRSIYLNFETSIMVDSKEFAENTETMLTEDMTHSRKMSRKQKGGWYGYVSQFMRLLSPLF